MWLELNLFLSNHDIDVMLISESHLKYNSKIQFKGYTLYHTPYPGNKARGGAAILIKSNINHYHLPSVQEKYLQSSSIKLLNANNEIAITAAYWLELTLKCRFSVSCLASHQKYALTALLAAETSSTTKQQ